MEKLIYPFERRPPNGEFFEVASGINWLRMPLPIALNHINLWLIENQEGWAIVDTGMVSDENKAIWNNILDQGLGNKPVKQLVVTHMHLDHVGLAGWLADKLNIDPHMTKKEYVASSILANKIEKNLGSKAIEFYKSSGFDDQLVETYIQRVGIRKNLVSPLSGRYHLLTDEQELHLGNHVWTVIVAQGHSPEHACLFCEELNIFICGDILLPRISPNVSVLPHQPDGNPLADWFESLEKIKTLLPEDVLVLPSHGYPYRGAHERIKNLIDEHRSRLDKLHKFCKNPQRAVDVFPVLFDRKIDSKSIILAIGESLSHLNYLIGQGLITMRVDKNGVKYFSQSD